MSLKQHKNTFIISFILIEIILGILIQITNGTINTIFSYGAIVLAFLTTLLFINRDKVYILTLVGLLFTCLADLLLVVIEPIHQIPAMIFFSITQICYFLRIYLNHQTSKEKIIHLSIRLILILTAIILTIIVLENNTDLLSIISLFYYANLVSNVIFSLTQLKRSKTFAVGLLCFMVCDLFIGLSILESNYLAIDKTSFLYLLCNPGFNIAWIFYVPSFTLIALSCINKK